MMARFFQKLTATCALIALLGAVAAPAMAQTIIRDSEIEFHLHRLSKPIFEAAGLTPDNVDFVLVADDQVNAFVAGGQNIFLYSGLFYEMANIAELMGVIAHETGHIAGGHLVRLDNVGKYASAQVILGTLLGVAVGAATGNGAAAGGIMAGGAEAGRRYMLRHSRTYESSADQAAIRFLASSGYGADGLASFLRTLGKQEYLPESLQSEYVRTHPLTKDRITTIDGQIKAMGPRRAWSPDDQEAFDRMRAKIIGYSKPESILAFYPEHDAGMAARYGRTVAAWRKGEAKQALAGLETLIAAEANNPYFHELKGQILFEQGAMAPAQQAYAKALALRPEDALMQISMGHVLLETTPHQQALTQQALAYFLKAERTEGKSPNLHRLLATAYGRMGQDGLAKMHLAEEALLKGDRSFARTMATQAKKMLGKSIDASLGQRLEDILKAAGEK